MSTMSPELALVDPELRADAVARLPPIYVNSFLEFPPTPVVVVPTAPASAVAPARGLGFRPTAVLAYLLVSLARTFVFDALVFASVAVLVLLASLVS